MYADRTLTPKEATRLCALGLLAGGPMAYADLARSVRRFIAHVIGPSLDVLGPSIELLKYERLIETTHDDAGGNDGDDDALLAITEKGADELRTLLSADIRPAGGDLNKLITALKFRFLHLLPAAEQKAQIDLLMRAADSELARLESLRDTYADEQGAGKPGGPDGEDFFAQWLERDICELTARLSWLESLRSAAFDSAA